MIELAVDLSLGGLVVAMLSITLQSLIQISYNNSDSKWKVETYFTIGKIKLLGYATSSFGGALGLLALLIDIKLKLN